MNCESSYQVQRADSTYCTLNEIIGLLKDDDVIALLFCRANLFLLCEWYCGAIVLDLAHENEGVVDVFLHGVLTVVGFHDKTRLLWDTKSGVLDIGK